MEQHEQLNFAEYVNIADKRWNEFRLYIGIICFLVVFINVKIFDETKGLREKIEIRDNKNHTLVCSPEQKNTKILKK